MAIIYTAQFTQSSGNSDQIYYQRVISSGDVYNNLFIARPNFSEVFSWQEWAPGSIQYVTINSTLVCIGMQVSGTIIPVGCLEKWSNGTINIYSLTGLGRCYNLSTSSPQTVDFSYDPNLSNISVSFTSNRRLTTTYKGVDYSVGPVVTTPQVIPIDPSEPQIDFRTVDTSVFCYNESNVETARYNSVDYPMPPPNKGSAKIVVPANYVSAAFYFTGKPDPTITVDYTKTNEPVITDTPAQTIYN